MTAPVRRRITAILMLAFLALVRVSAEDRIALEPPLVLPQTAEARQAVDRIVARALFASRTFYSQSFLIDKKSAGTNDAYLLHITASDEPPSRAFVLTLSSRSNSSTQESYTFFSPWTGDFGRVVASAINYLYESLTGFRRLTPGAAPVYVDTLTPAMLSSADLPYSVELRPYSVAVAPDGNIVVGTALVAVELGPLYREIGKPGVELLDQGVTSYAYDVAETPAGTLVSRPSSGADLYVIRPGEARPQRIRTGIDQPSATAVLDDGSVVVVDSLRHRAIRISGTRRMDFPIFPYPQLFVSAISAGPDDSLWVWDPVEGLIRIYTSRGDLAGSIIPLFPKADRAGIKALTALPDGSFLLLGSHGLWRFDRLGRPLWELKQLPAPGGGGFTYMNSVAYDPHTGFIYLDDFSSGHVVRLLDRNPPAGAAKPTKLVDRIVALNEKLLANPGDGEPYREKAKLYEKASAWVLAKAAWEHLLDLEPNDQQALSRAQAVSATILTARARRAAQRTMQLLERFGVENARVSYQTAVKLYERAIAAAPGDREARAELDRLKRSFEEANRPKSAPPALELVHYHVQPLFPALLSYYRSHPAGRITIRNDGSLPVRNLRLQVSMRYLDYPSESPTVDELKPGKSVEVPLYFPLSTATMSLEEDVPVQVLVDARYEVGAPGSGNEGQAKRVLSATVYRNTALTWAKTSQFAAFVTPHDSLISRFSVELAGLRLPAAANPFEKMDLPAKFVRAMKIIDGIGAYGMRYIEDPVAPFTKMFGHPEAVDTVRFPRTTLRIHSGDCDDTTALLASLLEAASIRTALMTSPGHIFLAFDSEAGVGEAWLFRAAGYRTIPYKGQLWIPIETTVLDSGFTIAWRDASRLVDKYWGQPSMEFIPTDRAQKTYPSIPLPPPSFDALVPSPNAVYMVDRSAVDSLIADVYRPAAASLERAASAAGSGAISAGLRLGILRARYGELSAARSVFEGLIAKNPGSPPAYINLANVQMLEKNYPAVEATLTRVLSLAPGLPAVNLLLAEAYRAQGKDSEAQQYASSVAKSDPRLAEQAGLAAPPPSSNAAPQVRASSQARSVFLPWTAGE